MQLTKRIRREDQLEVVRVDRLVGLENPRLIRPETANECLHQEVRELGVQDIPHEEVVA